MVFGGGLLLRVGFGRIFEGIYCFWGNWVVVVAGYFAANKHQLMSSIGAITICITSCFQDCSFIH